MSSCQRWGGSLGRHGLGSATPVPMVTTHQCPQCQNSGTTRGRNGLIVSPLAAWAHTGWTPRPARPASLAHCARCSYTGRGRPPRRPDLPGLLESLLGASLSTGRSGPAESGSQNSDCPAARHPSRGWLHLSRVTVRFREETLMSRGSHFCGQLSRMVRRLCSCSQSLPLGREGPEPIGVVSVRRLPVGRPGGWTMADDEGV